MTTPSIDDLTSQTKQFAETSAPDLQFSEAALEKRLALINAFRNRLIGIYVKAAKLADYGNVGNWPSANSAKYWLIQDVTLVRAALDKYIDYLNEHEKAVIAAHRRMQAHDSSD